MFFGAFSGVFRWFRFWYSRPHPNSLLFLNLFQSVGQWGPFSFTPLAQTSSCATAPGLWSRSRKESDVFGGVGFLTTVGVGVVFFCPTSTPEVQLDYFLHHTPTLGIPVEMVQFHIKLAETENSCCVPRFPFSVSCYKIFDSQTSFAFC